MTTDLTRSLTPPQPDFQLFQAFAEKANLVFWIADPQSYQLVYVSAAADRALDLPTDVWLRPFFWQTYLYQPDRDAVMAAFSDAVSSETVHHLEYRMVAGDGNLVWFRDRVGMLTVEERPFLCGMMTNVTAFKTAVDHHIGTRGYTSIFLEIVTLLSAGNVEIEQKLDQLAEKLCDVFELTAVSIFHWDLEWDTVAYLAYHTTQDKQLMGPDHHKNHRLSEVIDGLRWWHPEPNPILSDVNDTALSEWERTHLHLHSAKTIFYVPIWMQGEILGCIELIESQNFRNFTENDIELSLFVAKQTATAIAKAQLFKAEARRRREAEILLDVAEFVSSSLDRDEILARVMEILRVYLNDVHTCSISLITEDGLQLETILSWYAAEAYMVFAEGVLVNISDTFTAQLAINGGEPVIISDLKEIPFTNEFTTTMMKKGLRAILCVPLNIKSRAVGTLHIHHWHKPRRFSAEEIALLQGLANQAAIAIENARLFANERRQLNLSKTLQQVGALLTTSLQLEEVYEHIFDLLDRVVSYNSASLFLFDQVNNHFVLAGSRGLAPVFTDSRDFILSAAHVFKKIAISPGWSVVADVRLMPSWIKFTEDETVRAWIGAYLIVKGEINGILGVDGAIPGQYSDEDGRMVATFANQAAIAIENARLYDETMRQTKELAALNQVSQETAVSLNIDNFLEKITKLIGAELFPHTFGFIMYDVATKELRAHPSYLGIPEDVKQKIVPFPNSIIGQAVLSGEPYYAANVLEDSYYHKGTDHVLSEVAVPLKVNDEVIGVIDAASPELEAFSQRDIHFLSTLAGNIAAVLERARLYETLRIQAESLAEQVAQQTNDLKLEKDRLFAILESAGEGILLTDTESHIMYANPAMERQSGYSRDELRMQNPRILGSDRAQQSVFDDMWGNLSKQKSWAGELINQHKDGQIYHVAITVTPIADAEGEVTGYVSVQSDISRLKELERLKTEFIANVSHQLRTPLTNIKTYVSLLNRGKPEKFPHYFSVLHYEIDRLARLIQDLLDISRLDAEEAPDPDAAVDFCDFWEMFWPAFIERAERENRILRVPLPPEIVQLAPIVFIESYQLEKILSRLVENSLIYSHRGGAIQILVAHNIENSDVLEIKVCDEGPGIPEAERPFIFDRFFRGAQAIESGLPGNGLGLAIVKELLAKYGGEISLESESGNGNCFIVHLPLVHKEGQEPRADEVV